MFDESISQAEIDALVHGMAGGTGGNRPPHDDAQPLLRQAVEEFINQSCSALATLVANPTKGTLVHLITGSSAADVSERLPSAVIFGPAIVLEETALAYAMPVGLGTQIITQIYGGISPTALDEAALGALGDGLTQMNQAGLTWLSGLLGRPLPISPVNVAVGATLVEAEGGALGTNLVAAGFDLNVGDAADRVYLFFPPEFADLLIQAVRAQRMKSNGPMSSATAASSAAYAVEPEDLVAAAVQQGYPVVPNFPDLGQRGQREESRNIDLLMDVTLQVTVELGRTRRQIREVLGLSPGSVLELDKLAGEQVDVLVNGKLIAKAEVVVIDENYGVRITDIISPVERVQSLK